MGKVVKLLTVCSLFWFSFITCTGLIQGQTSDIKGNRIFIVYNTGEGQQEFRDYAKVLSRLKPYGRVDICINSPALKSDYEIPPNSCDWHEYASFNRSVAAFFPDNKLAPYFPADLVSKNLQLLLYKAGILKELGLNASFRSNEPRFLPEAFFEKYPHLRGPRVDHPRRSVRKEFAPCFHQSATVDMYSNMVGQLFKYVPDLRSFYFSMNDAGSGFCWEDWLYSGPNGPVFCKNINKSEDIIAMLNVYKSGAKQTGHDIDIIFKGMFTDQEADELEARLPEKCFLESSGKWAIKQISTMGAYPVRGIINPLEIIRILERHTGTVPERYMLTFASSYSRGHETVATIEKVVDIIEHLLSEPVKSNEINELQPLRELCLKWGGSENADFLLKAFTDLDKVLNEEGKDLRGLSPLYWGVSARQITRPLVFAPQKLTADEEKYFLPYVFNISVNEARNDYMDIHGGDREIALDAVDSLVSRINAVCLLFEKIQKAPEQKFLENLTRSLRLYSCILKTCGNFNDAQIIRNRNREILAGPVHRPDKIPTWTGDKDLLAFNEIMRKELDNTQEMIDILENGGMEQMCIAGPPFKEDTFILGPGLISQLKLKRKVMLAHWTDIEGYLTTPFK